MVGCRKPLTPNIDRNKAPETWITAAPFDTITIDPSGPRPLPSTIPIRFHVYWAGGDVDGSVVGYYWAVVETLPLPPEGGASPPPLPGPRAHDYRYTTRTDSVFIFNVAEDIPDRQHAFFIYAVDDKGKADPTPARFIFNALDRFPPIPVFDEASATGTIYYFDQGGVLRSETRTYHITDPRPFPPPLPTDTVPSGSRLKFRFHGEVTVPGSIVKGFRYKLDEAQLQPVDPDSLYHGDTIEYGVPAAERDPSRNGLDTLKVAPGLKVFTLRAVDQANGSQDAWRRFVMNFSPDTWFAGPDPDRAVGYPWETNSAGEKFALLVNGRLPAALPGSLLGPDSTVILPVDRPYHRTFFEIYKDTVFLRREGDTVHLGCWVVIHNGGFDTDSPYAVKVVDGIEDLLPPGAYPGGPVLTPDQQNGSPIGFRSLITAWLTPNGPLNSTSLSRLYPFYDPNDFLHFPRIGVYQPMPNSGKAYSLQRAEDGDGARDNRVDDARRLVETPGNNPLKQLVMTFEVNFPPLLKTFDPSFRPRTTAVDTFTNRIWDLRILGDDRDPYRSGDPFGGPSDSRTLRLRFKLVGKDADGNTITFYDPPQAGVQQKYINVSDINMLVPAELATGPATLTVELCDCSFCELNPGEGRCISRDIQVYYVAPPPGSAATSSRPGLE